MIGSNADSGSLVGDISSLPVQRPPRVMAKSKLAVALGFLYTYSVLGLSPLLAKRSFEIVGPGPDAVLRK